MEQNNTTQTADAGGLRIVAGENPTGIVIEDGEIVGAEA